MRKLLLKAALVPILFSLTGLFKPGKPRKKLGSNPPGNTGQNTNINNGKKRAKKARPAKKAAAKKAAAKKAAAKKAAKATAPAAKKKPRNSHLAGSNHPTTNVPFDSNGYPDFSQWRHPTVSDVRITLTGSRSKDFTLANQKAGLTSTPAGYTWHHHQDKGLMQLIETGVHRKTGHTGGFSN
ncbi:HNH endonuclease [Glycomyces tenuis]|uniref:HNH endonuclease n=1 Tax=Glycomyces tenuis TaxID=58116 RepID=UPI0004176A4F|nr:HNH endonuclease [Glycomyces tenuis]